MKPVYVCCLALALAVGVSLSGAAVAQTATHSVSAKSKKTVKKTRHHRSRKSILSERARRLTAARAKANGRRS
jgi:hypothetical protein